MRTLCLVLVGVVVGWAASGVDLSREAAGQDSSTPTPGAERSIRRERDGVLRRRGLLPPRETAAPAPGTDAPRYDPNANAEPRPDVPPSFDPRQGPSLGMEELAEPSAEPARNAVSSPGVLGRYQVSAYGSPNGHGCYIVDTMTGRTWHVSNGQPPQVVSEALSPLGVHSAMAVPASTYDTPALLSPPSVVPQPSTTEPTPAAAD